MLSASRFATTTIFLTGVLIAGRAPLAHSRSSPVVRACASAHPRSERHARCAKPRVFSVLKAALTGEGEIQSVLEAPCQNTGLLPTPGNLQLIREAVFCLVNQERARNSEPPLTSNTPLQNAAQAHSEDMIEEDYFGHVSPGGLQPAERILQTGYLPSPQDGYTIGENIAWETLEGASATATVAAWIASPEHLANILEARYTETGIGVVAQVPRHLDGGVQGATYTQDFGARG